MFGGSETRPTCTKSIVKTEAKKMAGDVVKIERMLVKMTVIANSGHLRSSTQAGAIPEMNVNDLGKLESNDALSIPLR